jgi:hypothetical protein
MPMLIEIEIEIEIGFLLKPFDFDQHHSVHQFRNAELDRSRMFIAGRCATVLSRRGRAVPDRPCHFTSLPAAAVP